MTAVRDERDRASAGHVYDELLVTLIWSGERRAAERLAVRWQPRLLRTAQRLVGDEDLALGAVQDAWVSILRGIGSLKDPAKFAPWAFGILRRRCADAVRSTAARQKRILPGQLPERAEQPRAEEAIALRQAFASLSANQRLAAHLFFVEGLTLAEIAEAAGVPLGTAKSRLFNARLKLKAALKGEER